MSRYKPVRKARVYMFKPKTSKTNFKKLIYYGFRTLYKKDNTRKLYVRYEIKYYLAYPYGYNTYEVIVR